MRTRQWPLDFDTTSVPRHVPARRIIWRAKHEQLYGELRHEVDFHLLATNTFHYQHHRHQHRGTNGFLLQWQGPTNRCTKSVDGHVHAGGVEHDFEPGHQRELDADQRALQFFDDGS